MRRTRGVLIAIAAMISAVLILGLLIVTLFNADLFFRPRIEKEISDRTNYRVTVGTISVTPSFSGLQLHLENVTALPPEGARGVAISVGRISIDISLHGQPGRAIAEKTSVHGYQENKASTEGMTSLHLETEEVLARAPLVLKITGPRGREAGEIEAKVFLDETSRVAIQGANLDLGLWVEKREDALLTGRGKVDFEFTRAGDIASGHGRVSLEDGSWSSLRALESFKDKIAMLPGAQEKLQEMPPATFKTIEAEIELADQNVSIKKGTAQSQHGNVTVLFEGQVSLDGPLKIGGEILLPAKNIPKRLQASDGRLQVPLRIGGTLKDPKPDWQPAVDLLIDTLLTDDGQKAIKKGLKNLLDKAPQNIKDLLKGIKF